MLQAQIALITPYYAFFKDDVDLVIEGNKIAATLGSVTIFLEQSAIYPFIRPAIPEEITSLDNVTNLLGVLSYDEQPKGSFDFEITHEDGENAEWGYYNTMGCPFFKAIKKAFPNLKFGSVGRQRVFKGKSITSKVLAIFAEGFTNSDMINIRTTKQPFKTTITFL